ncbi:hypothetical protein STRCR_1962 [Streptococcus criceti HS-6]|uniref:Uncharacterized protein n=1 Tax=Streptococcus criceti HS-6 TaxID=873449 RepID=G5JR76_STRCG|nr:hypothetical protein STRCR_1962 [Streptococcus criceti HS-6]
MLSLAGDRLNAKACSLSSQINYEVKLPNLKINAAGDFTPAFPE